MSTAIAPLEADRLRELVADSGIEIEVLAETDSTNDWLLRLAPNAAHQRAAFAEVQLAGRGRHGRPWCAQSGRHILLSFGWRFDAMPAPGLSLAAGVAVRGAIEYCGITDVMLKWPNDLYWCGRKLAGILVETRITSRGVLAVIGVGINVALDDEEPAAIITPAVDLRAILGHLPDRNSVGAVVIEALNSCCDTFATRGFDAFRDDWNRYDVNAGHLVRIMGGNDSCEGQALGVTADGSLRLQVAGGGERIFRAGDVSLRAI